MTRTFSAYLDFVRFYAAFCVFASHLSERPYTENGLLWRVKYFTTDAVPIFFVLSGFVIAYVLDKREFELRQYAANRAARILSVVLPALVLTFALDTLGDFLNPTLYDHQNVLLKEPSIAGYVSSLAFVNEYQILGLGGISPGTNVPFWSLSFEVTYYVIAGLLFFVPRWWGLPIAGLLLAAGGATITAMAPLWAAGFFLYRYRDALRLHFWIAVPMLLATSLLIVMMQPWVAPWNERLGVFLPFGSAPYNREIVSDYLTSIVFVANMVAAYSVFHRDLNPPEKFCWILQKLGALTFTLYCIHFPVMCFLTATSPFATSSWAHVAYVVSLVLIVTAILTPITDRFKICLRGYMMQVQQTARR